MTAYYRNVTADIYNPVTTIDFTAKAFLEILQDGRAKGKPQVPAHDVEDYVYGQVGHLRAYDLAKRAIRNMGYNITSKKGPIGWYELEASEHEVSDGLMRWRQEVYTSMLGTVRGLQGQVLREPLNVELHHLSESFKTDALSYGVHQLHLTMQDVLTDIAVRAPKVNQVATLVDVDG